MIISRTPYRISLFGGGTDYPAWFQKHGGSILASTIDKYCTITCRYLPPFFEYKSRIAYSIVELVKSNESIQHPAVRETLKLMGIQEGVEIHHDGDLPARTGLGSSSSFTVGLLQTLSVLKGDALRDMELALKAIHVEQECLKETVGCQDQILAALGGFLQIDFLEGSGSNNVRVTKLDIEPDRIQTLEEHLLLFFTGISRFASEIAAEQLAQMEQNEKALLRMREMVDEALPILVGQGGLSPLGELLHESWLIKRDLSSKVSSSFIDEIYSQARSAGALGGKLLGAGGGGFMLLFAKSQDHSRIQRRLKHLLHVPFHFEKGGSQIVFQPGDVFQNPIETGQRAFVK